MAFQQKFRVVEALYQGDKEMLENIVFATSLAETREN